MALKITPAIDERLKSEHIVWITSVRADGVPQPTPVWFLWHDAMIVIFTQPQAQKVKNLLQNPHVALNLNTDQKGGKVLVITGDARVSTDSLPAGLLDAYLAKYEQGIKDIGMTPESMSDSFSTAIYVTPTRVRTDE